MNVTSLLAIALGAILTNNFILVKFLGICPFMGVSKKTDTALGMGVAVTFVMALASMVTWAVDHYILTPLDLGYMQTAAFILIIAAIVQVVEMFLKKSVPTLYQALGIYLPLITTNCAVLGVALLNIQEHYNFLESLVYGFTGGLGFTRNMSMGEILGQLQAARAWLGDDLPERPIIRNLVYMGMGEPLLNLPQVMRSLQTLHHPRGLNFSARRITVSTCGIEHGSAPELLI